MPEEQSFPSSWQTVEFDAGLEDRVTGESSQEEGFFSRIVAPKAPRGFVMWQHKKSRCLHLAREGYKKIFQRGRSIGSFHALLKEGQDPGTCKCRVCFKSAEREISGM